MPKTVSARPAKEPAVFELPAKDKLRPEIRKLKASPVDDGIVIFELKHDAPDPRPQEHKLSASKSRG